MADVFVSYCQQDRPIAEALARDLLAHGYSVWWDAELVGTDNYYDVILDELRRAKAVVVIWTKASAKSRFVRDEARYALHLEKLVPVKVPELSIYDIPLGFQGQHTDEVTNRAQIVRAIAKLGARAQVVSAQPTQAPLSGARDRLAEPKALTRSNVESFFSGLMLQVPKFQLSKQATWNSIGAALGYALLAGVLVHLALAWSGQSSDGSEAATGLSLLSAGAFGAMAIFAWFKTGTFLGQRNFIPAVILSLAFAVLASLATQVLIDEFLVATTSDDHLLYFSVLMFVFLNVALWRIPSYR